MLPGRAQTLHFSLHALSTIEIHAFFLFFHTPVRVHAWGTALHHAFSRTQFFIETVRLKVSRSLRTFCTLFLSRRHLSLSCPPCASSWHIYVLPEDGGPQAPLREAPRPLVAAKGRHGHAQQQGSPCVGCRRRDFSCLSNRTINTLSHIYAEHQRLTRSNHPESKQPITINIKHAKDKRKKHR